MSLIRIAPLLVAALPLATGPDPVEIRFAPRAGTTWTKAFEYSQTSQFESMTVVMDGNEVPGEFLPQFEIDATEEQRFVFTDHYVEIDEERPLVVRRRFDAIEVEQNMDFSMTGSAEGSRSSHGTGTSALEGKSVVFAWDESEEEYEAKWGDEKGADGLLEGLDEDLGLRALLPDAAVAIGDSWEVSGDDEALFQPGGDLHIELEGTNVEDFEHPEAGDVSWSAFVRLADIEDVDGARIAVLEVEGELTTVAEGEGSLDDVPVADGTATVTTTVGVAFEGELRWDLSAGILRSLELTGATEVVAVTSKDPGQPGPEFASTMSLSGTFQQTVAIEPAD